MREHVHRQGENVSVARTVVHTEVRKSAVSPLQYFYFELLDLYVACLKTQNTFLKNALDIYCIIFVILFLRMKWV